jgi:hypothetical protein
MQTQPEACGLSEAYFFGGRDGRISIAHPTLFLSITRSGDRSTG